MIVANIARLVALLACMLVYVDAMRVIFYPRIRPTTKRRVLYKRAAVGPIWPTRQIPYAFSNIIDFGFEDRDLIKATLKQIEASLAMNGENCIEFVERDKQKDYILFFNRGDCSSGIGFQPGLNNVSLASGCLTPGTIVHEVMHRIGFDHEHSRHDRDKNIQVLFENANDVNNFRLNPDSREDTDTAPYDFHSIIHYNSNAFKKDGQPTIVSKIPALYSDHNEIHMLRDRLSPIDIFKIQSLYKCRTLSAPATLTENDAIEEERIEKINKRFMLETEFNRVESELANRYLEKTYEMCGIDYVWPVDYPLVESKHRLYKLLCQKKKEPRGRCRYSIECNDEEAFCLRPLFKKKGYCVKLNNEKLNSLGQTINDKMFEYGIKVKNGFKKIFKM